MTLDVDFGRSEVYDKAIECYGKDNQIRMAIEEMSELTKELCKYFRGESYLLSLSSEIAKEGCVYRNLRKFINENRITKTELVRRCGLTAHGSNLEYLERFMKGYGDPRKSYIDRLLKVTGLSYGELFSKEEENAAD